MLKELVGFNLSKEQIDLLVIGVTHWAGLSFGSKFIEHLVNSIIKRFKTVDNDLVSDQ